MTAAKFLQPAQGIKIVSKAEGPSIQMEQLLEIGRERVAAGESVEEVSLDLAQWDAAMEELPDELKGLAGRETLVHEAADTYVQKVEVACRFAFAKGRAAINYPALRSATAVAEAKAATAGVEQAVQKALEATLPKVLLDCLIAGGEAGVELLSQYRTSAKKTQKDPVTFNYKFDSANGAAIKWAKKHAAKMIDGISKVSKKRVNAAIVRTLEGTGTFAEAVEDIAKEVGSDERAQVIAHHETMEAASEGQRQAWQQAVDAGLLTGDEQRVWIYTPGNACPVCKGLDGKVADLNGTYPGDGGDGPPQHVGCRCTEGLQP